MATITAAAGGGNWNVGSTWVGGVVPLTTDNVVLNATSGQVTITATAQCVNINFTGYTNTITFNANLTITGDLTRSASVFSYAGTFGIIIAGTTTQIITTSSVAWTIPITFGGISPSISINGAFNITAPLTLSSTTSPVIARANVFDLTENVNPSGNITISGGGTYTGSANIVILGSNNQTFTAGFNHQIRNNLTINKTGGVLTLSGTLNYNTGTFTYTAGTVNTGTSTLNIGATTTFNTNGSTISGATTTSSTGINWFNVTLSSTLNLTSNFTSVGTFTANAGAITRAASESLYLGGSLTMSSTLVSSSTPIIMNGTGTWSGSGLLYASLTFNTTGTITISGTVSIATTTFAITLTYIVNTGSVVTSGSTLTISRGGTSTSLTLNTGTLSWNNIQINGYNQIGGVTFVTLASDLNMSGNLLTVVSGINGVNCQINGLFNVNVGGNLSINATTTGTSTIVLNGIGNQTWSSTGYYLSNSLTINKTSGTLTIGTLALPNIYYNAGTLTDNNIGGTVNASTNSSTLNINSSCTLNTSSITWYNITNNATQTLTLTSNLVWSNNWNVTAGTISFANIGTLSPSSTANVNFSGSSIINLKNNIQITNATFNATTINTNTISVSGNLTVSGSTSGTTTTNINGSGSQTWTSTAYLSAPLTIAKTVGSTLLLSANTYYGTGTLTYVSGTIDSTTNSNTLNLTGSPSLNTLGTTWNKVTFSNITITLLSDFTATGLTNVVAPAVGTALSVAINGVGRKYYANGGMTCNSTSSNGTLSGTAELRFEGIGYWQTVASGNNSTWYQIDTVINPTGNFFIDVRFIINKITYSNTNGGTITSANLLIGTNTTNVWSGGITLDTNDLFWNSITYFNHNNTAGSSSTLTSLSSINCNYWVFYNVGTATNFNVNFSFTSGGILNTGTFYVAQRVIVNLPTNANFETDNLYFSNGGAAITGNTQLNNGTVVVKRVLEKQDAFNSSFGTTLIKFANNSSWSNLNGGISFVMEILGNVTFNGNSYSQATLKYTGNINSPIAKGTLNITANCALTNMHKLTFNNLVITSGTTMTMNEFFSGLPDKNSIVGASSTSNFNVTFTDNFEKIAKFINVNGVTFTRPQQLLLLTNQPKKSRNIGIRYNNQSPNGSPKNDPSVQNQMTYSVPKYLVGDPNMIKSM